MRKSVETNSSSLKADAWHHRSDAITSLMAFIGISISLVMGPGWEAADDVAALFASSFILYNAYKILRPALGEIMDEQLYENEIEQIREIASHVPGVMATEKCNVRKNGMNYYVDLDVITQYDTYSFQIMNNEVVYQMMERIKDYPVEDPLGLVDIYLNKRDMVQLNQYINRHFRKWAKEYHLDNPRDSIIRRYK